MEEIWTEVEPTSNAVDVPSSPIGQASYCIIILCARSSQLARFAQQSSRPFPPTFVFRLDHQIGVFIYGDESVTNPEGDFICHRSSEKRW